MATYRPDRNIKISIKDYITLKLAEAGWSGVSIVNAFSEVRELSIPCICIRISSTTHEGTGVGETTTMREPFILLDIFGTNHTQASDLKDFLVSILKTSFNYKQYSVVSGVSSSIVIGKLVPQLPIKDVEVYSGQDKSKLDKVDQNRYLISFNIKTNQVEA